MMTESETLEFKSSLSEWKETIITLAAFANKKGGKIIIGINDQGEPMGLHVGKGTLEDLVNKIKHHTDPVLYPSVNVKTFGLGEIIEVEIAQNDNKPVFAFERAYIRVGKANQKLSTAAVRDLIKRYTLPDFDKRLMDEEIRKHTFDSKLIKEVDSTYYHFHSKSDLEFLKRLKVISKGKISNAGYLCFIAKNTLMPNAVIKAARFKGENMASFLDMKDFSGPLISAVDDVLDFIKRHTNMEIVIAGKAKRDEVWDYPLPALREAFINAIVHRDYTDSGNIQIRIFNSMLEIWSPGLLPKEINIKNLLKENRSIPKNKSLMEIFHDTKLIEGWGSGFQKIFNWSMENGNSAPLFSEKTGAFVVTFNKRKRSEGLNEGINEGLNEGINEGLKNLQNYIEHHPGKRTSSIAKTLKVPSKTIERWIKTLKEKGVIEYRGSKKTGGYY